MNGVTSDHAKYFIFAKFHCRQLTTTICFIAFHSIGFHPVLTLIIINYTAYKLIIFGDVNIELVLEVRLYKGKHN